MTSGTPEYLQALSLPGPLPRGISQRIQRASILARDLYLPFKLFQLSPQILASPQEPLLPPRDLYFLPENFTFSQKPSLPLRDLHFLSETLTSSQKPSFPPRDPNFLSVTLASSRDHHVLSALVCLISTLQINPGLDSSFRYSS